MAIAMPYQFFQPFQSKSWAFKDKPLLTTSFKAILTPEDLIDSNLPKGRRLYKFITTAAKNIANQIIAHRLSLIYSVHEIDSHSKYECGKKLKTGAYEQVSKEWDCSLDCVKLCERRGKSYTKLIQEAGPAIIFELDNDVSSLCENSLLTDDQRKLFIQWLLLQSKQDRFAKCISAAKIILEGLITYGYTYHELRTTQSRLLEVLRVYLSWEDDTIRPNKDPNDPAHQTSVNHSGTSNQESRRSTSSSSSISESTDNSPYYSGPGGSGDVPSHVPRPIDTSRQDLVAWEDDGTIHSSDLSQDFRTWHNVIFDPDTNAFYGLDTHNSTNGPWQDGFFDPDTQHPTNGLWRNVLVSETSSNDSMGLLPQFPYCGSLDAQPSGF
ncbi:hypothetical protein RJ035_002425 [Blastomyces gilchristii]